MSPVRDTDVTNTPNLDDSVTFKKQVYRPPDKSQPSENSESTIIDPGEPTVTEPLRTEPTVAEPLKPTSESLHSHKKPELVDEDEITELCSEIQTLNSKFSIFESSSTNISADVLSINSAVLALQQTMKNELITAVKATVSRSLSKGNTNNQTENQEVNRLKKSIDEKERIFKSKQETISNLNDKLQDNLALHEPKISDVKRNYQQQITSFNSRIDNLNKENNKLEDQLAFSKSENEQLQKEIDSLKSKLEFKDQHISGLNDRLETIRLDYEGGQWRTSTPVRSRISVPSILNHGSPDIRDPALSTVKDTQIVPSDTEQRSEPSMIIMEDLKDAQIPVESENNIQGNDIIFIHDSIHKHIDYDVLAKNTNKAIKSEFAATIEQFENKVSAMNLNSNDLLISHIGTNDIRRGENVNDAAKRYVNIIQRVTRKGHKVIVSLLTAVKHRDLDQEITKFNQTITELLGSYDKVTFCDNENIRGGPF